MATITVMITNRGRWRMRGVVRDRWPPSARPQPPRQRIDIAASERRRTTTVLHPARRTKLEAGFVSSSVGP